MADPQVAIPFAPFDVVTNEAKLTIGALFANLSQFPSQLLIS